jgi:DnaD/phage-associated family protein
MASGRMITNAICADKRINLLQDDTSRLAFTWIITFADREGRTYGDPGVVRSMLFPRRQDVTIEQMETYIVEWHNLGLIVWYEADFDKWIYFPNFDKNQPGMRKEKEAPSRIPCPPSVRPSSSLDNLSDGVSTELVRSKDGVSTSLVPFKRKEKKRKEEKGIEPAEPAAAENIFSLYSSEIGPLTAMIGDSLKEAEKVYPVEWFQPAFKEAADHNARSWKYIEAILKNWQANGFKSKSNGKKPAEDPHWAEEY